jgi:hypothetical protein
MYEPGVVVGKGTGSDDTLKFPNDFWTAMEKGLHGYTRDPKGGAITT